MATLAPISRVVEIDRAGHGSNLYGIPFDPPAAVKAPAMRAAATASLLSATCMGAVSLDSANLENLEYLTLCI